MKYEGVFLWIGSGNVIDWIAGFSFKRGFYADKCYNTGNTLIKDIWQSLFKWDDGFVRIIPFSN